MKKLLRLLAVAIAMPCASLFAQCPTGYTTAALNWDALDFFTTNGTYATYISAAAATTQKFAFGTQVATITHSYTGSLNGGENTTNSAATGADLQFSGNGTITVSFASAVQNVSFTLYDIDRSQRATVTASNGVVPAGVTLTRLGGGSTILTLNSVNPLAPYVTASNTSVANSSLTAAATVNITGPVTTFTITLSASGSDPIFWVGDISACSNAAAFPTGYYAVSQPYSGQPGYVLISANTSVYQVNPATGASKLLFTDPAGSNINSMGYDPYQRILYYTYSLTATPATDKKVMKYDFVTETISTFINDVTTIGIPVFENGVESGAAAFYNGELYLGIEGYNLNNVNTGRKSVVWRIPITNGAAGTAIQVFGIAADNGLNTTHDWSDFGINNGILYDFDGSVNGDDIYQYNMQSGVITQYNPTTRPSQIAVDWNGTIYNMDSTITPYNGTTGLVMGQRYALAATPAFAPGTSFGDAAEGFRPDADFGDAPSTYDPVALSPAMHEVISTLRLGVGTDDEFSKKTSTLANGDTDDGMPFVAIVNQGGNYLANVNVFNNTGANATVCAWVDFNNDGVFAPSEGISVTVPSSASLQNIDLFWPNPTNTLAPHSYTFFRVRITSASNGMTTANPTGYFSDGEVEDYRVQVNSTVLPVDLVRFEAKKAPQGKAQLTWEIADELAGAVYELQRSSDGKKWAVINRQLAVAVSSKSVYSYNDEAPVNGKNHYRLKIVKPSKNVVFSPVRILTFEAFVQLVVAPNPVTATSRLLIKSSVASSGLLQVVDMSGRSVHQQKLALKAGDNALRLPFLALLTAGSYEVQVWVNEQRISQRVLVKR